MSQSRQLFQTGDFVRISRYKQCFEKGYTPNWSTEIFSVSKILPTEPITYLIKDLHGHQIRGSFYGFELQKSNECGVYLVEKILKRKGNMIFVKWIGFDESENSWVKKADLI